LFIRHFAFADLVLEANIGVDTCGNWTSAWKKGHFVFCCLAVGFLGNPRLQQFEYPDANVIVH
jgi:hypothetical protein